MNPSSSFRLQLARRLFQIAAIAAPATAPLMGCGPRCGSDVGSPTTVCFDPSTITPPGGGAGGGSTSGTGGGAPGTDGGTLDGCPTGNAANDAVYEAWNMGGFFDIESGPTKNGSQCCYVVQKTLDCTGRPFLVDDALVAAPPRPFAGGWNDAKALAPRVDDLTAEERAALAEAWTRDGLLEHASVASFGRFALELLAAGAPSELVELAHAAALDEVRHARLCLGLASAYGGSPVGPGAFPFAGRIEVTADLASIAARAAREGCIGETLAALQAAEQLARATDPAVRAALAIIAEDEARHAELAWRAVVWAVREGGEPVRAAVAAVLANLEDGGGEAGPRREGLLDRHGRLAPEEQRRLAARAIAEVVRPAARVLLAGVRPQTEEPGNRSIPSSSSPRARRTRP